MLLTILVSRLKVLRRNGDSKKYLTSNNIEVHYGMYLFANWMRQNRGKVLKQFLEKEGCEAKIATENMFLDLVESSTDL